MKDVFQRGLFELALFDAGGGAQARQVQAVDGVHHFIQLALVSLAVGGILVRRLQHGVDGGVEFLASVRGIVALVIPLTGFKPQIGPPDQGIGASPALGELRIGQQEGGDILQVQIGLNDGRFGKLDGRAGGRNAIRNLAGWLSPRWLNPHPAVTRAAAAKKKSVFVRTSITASNYRK